MFAKVLWNKNGNSVGSELRYGWRIQLLTANPGISSGSLKWPILTERHAPLLSVAVSEISKTFIPFVSSRPEIILSFN